MSQDHNSSTPDSSANIVYPMRLQKFLARAGVASRRGSEDLMTAGRVCVNGVVVTELGSKVDPNIDTVTVDGISVVWGNEPVYIVLNKPAGYLTTMNDPQNRPCVASLVPTKDYPGLYPVGRLDKQTRGLLLFTTDGQLGHGLLHPSHHVTKTYIAQVEGIPTERELQLLRNGVDIQDGKGLTAPADVVLLEKGTHTSLLSIAIHEGRNRQVRRMCGAIHHECLDLQRISFGPLTLDGIEEGTWKILDENEASAIKSAVQ